MNINMFGSRLCPTSVGPRLGPNCLQNASADNKTCPVAKELMWPFGQFSIKHFWCSFECITELLLMCNHNLCEMEK